MFINALRAFYFIVPLIILAWSLMAYDSLKETLHYVNTWQGHDGLIHINSTSGSGTWGESLEVGLNSVLGAHKDTDWGNFDEKMGADLDQMIGFVENYWVDILAVILFFGGAILCISGKNYK